MCATTGHHVNLRKIFNPVRSRRRRYVAMPDQLSIVPMLTVLQREQDSCPLQHVVRRVPHRPPGRDAVGQAGRLLSHRRAAGDCG